MKKILVLFFFLGVAMTGFAKSADYQIDDQLVEQKLSAAQQVSFNLQEMPVLDMSGIAAVQADKNVWIAVALDFFLGGIAVHRVYLGGKPLLILTYFITCGGIFGIVPLIDLIVLVIDNEDISQYVGNDKFFMWGN